MCFGIQWKLYTKEIKMKDYEVGNHYSKREFDCLKCAEDYYDALDGLKYLAECDTSGVSKIIRNTYGWKNS